MKNKMVAVVRYPAGNIRSVLFALERLGVKAEWTADPQVLHAATHVILPGVGEASTAMLHLRETGLDEVIRQLQQPVLGICLGLQLFCRHSEEGNTTCLGTFPETVKRFLPENGIKVPHMGWNTCSQTSGLLFEGLSEDNAVYFVHSYFAGVGPDTAAVAQHGTPFSAALQRDNFFAVQFHPEKSGPVGQRILQNFLTL
jgi:glutamine amidotransferase